MRFNKITLTLLCAFLMTSMQASAIGIGARAGTLGLGMEFSQPLAKKVTARFGFNGFNFPFEGTESGIDYELELKLNTVATLIDWHPTGGGFRVSTGIYINSSQIAITSTSQGQYDIGDNSYTGDINLQGEIDFLPVVPYFGIGWGMQPSKRSGWNMTAEIGAFFQSSPSVSLSADGTATRINDNVTIDVSSDALFIENLAIEEAKLNDEYDNYNFYPVISLGFLYSF